MAPTLLNYIVWLQDKSKFNISENYSRKQVEEEDRNIMGQITIILSQDYTLFTVLSSGMQGVTNLKTIST